MTRRYSNILMVLALAAFALLVCFNNITDYSSNFAFVRHVLSMDTTFEGNTLMYRAITSPVAWHVAYVLIIAAEGLAGLMLLMGALAMFSARDLGPEAFDRSKTWVIAGATTGFLVWFFGSMVMGGEWFAMWQSGMWNGQEAAFRFYMAILGVLIYVNQPEPD